MKIHRHIAIPVGQVTLPAMGRHSLLRAILSAEMEKKAETATAAERG